MLVSANGNVQYFNASYQTGPESYSQIVCFSPSKRNQFHSMSTEKRPVTLSQVTLSPSKKRGFIRDIKFNDSSSLSVNDSPLDFNSSTRIKSTAFTIQDLKDVENNTVVDCTGYIQAQDRPIIPVQLSYRRDTIKKKEVTLNDENSSISLTLWGEIHINNVPNDGTYKLEKVILKKIINKLVSHNKYVI